MKKYLFIVLLVGFCFGQEILPSEDSKCSLDGGKLMMTIGGIETKTINDSLYRRYRCDENISHQYWVLHWKYDVKPYNPCREQTYKALLEDINKKGSVAYLVPKQREIFEKLDSKCIEFSSKEADSIKAVFSKEIKSNNPCFDDKYLELKQLEFDEMSEREFQYFIIKEKQCGEYDIWWKNKYDSPTSKAIKESTPKEIIKEKNSSSQDTEINPIWLELGNILLDHSSDNYDMFGGIEQTCQYDDHSLKSTFETKIDGEGLRKFRKYKCTNISNTHYYWMPE